MLLLACKGTSYFLIFNACWAISIVDIFNIDWINHLPKNEASRDDIYFKVIRPNEYSQIYSREKWESNDQISKNYLETACKK